ncbi:MAG TPA: patatin-like phospholipase family protein [Baekduia sp.]|nr:patatin-like phospholipase family protein [Baekduia sp.]
MLPPDVLVLAGGGVVGESWMHGVLAGLEDALGWDARAVESFVGTSAGSIVAARLAAGRRPPRPGAIGSQRPPEGASDLPPAPADDGRRGLVRSVAGAARGTTAPLVGAALAAGAPVGAFARAAVLSRAPDRGRSLLPLRDRAAGWGARFDGRLRVCAVDRRSGRRVVFGAPGAPAADVADAVAASCAIPWVFAPVRIGDREYVDGGAWSITNLDAAPAGRGTHVLCLDPVAGVGGDDRRMTALRGAFRVAAGLEQQGLRRRGALVRHLAPDAAAAAAMGPDLMAPARASAALAAGYRQGLAVAGAAST